MAFRYWLSYVKPNGLPIDVNDVDAVEWEAHVAVLGPATISAQHRVHLQFAPWLYSVIAPGIHMISDPPPWNPGDYGIFQTKKFDTWSSNWAALPPGQPDKFLRYGVRMVGSTEGAQRQAHRFADTDGDGINLSAATGGSTTHLTADGPWTDRQGAAGFVVVVRPNTPQEEERTITVKVQSPPRLDWAVALVNGAVTAGTQFEVRHQRSEVEMRTPFQGEHTVGYSIEKVGTVTNPSGDLWRSAYSGQWYASLSGAHSIYRVSNRFDGGPMSAVADYYLPTPFVEDYPADYPSLVMEMHYDEPALPIDSIPTDVRWSSWCYRDKETKRWHEAMKFKITIEENSGSDQNWGWHLDVPGKLRHRAGVSGLKALNSYLLTGLTFESSAGVPLPWDAGFVSTPGGSATYNGRGYRAAGGFPFVLLETGRGFYVMHPGTTEPASCVYTATRNGTYYFDGDFARASVVVSPQGDGVDVRVESPGLILFSDIVSSSAINPDPDDPFTPAGNNKHFSVSTYLQAGQQVRFVVEGRANISFDTTAFRVSVAVTRSGLTLETERAFMSEAVTKHPITLLSFEAPSFGALRFCSDSVPVTSRGNVYTPAPLLDVKLAPSQPGQFPTVEFSIGVNDQSLTAALRSLDESPTIRYELVLAESPDVVQKGIGSLRIESVELGLLRITMSLGVFPLFQVIGPKRAYTPDIAPGVHL